MAIAAPVLGASASVPRADPRRGIRRPAIRIGIEPSGRLVLIDRNALLYRSFAYFFSQLLDESGTPFVVAEHNEEWADLFQYCLLLVLMAPRDHGKSVTVIAYLLWHLWRHNRDPWSGELYEDLHEGKWEGVLFSDTLPQAGVLFEKLQGVLLANAELFADLMPSRGRRVAQTLERWSTRQIRLRNGADLKVRGYRTSTRGLHPDMIICDDVLNDQNTLTAYQREKVWRYFVATLLPMNAKQYILVGTALHLNDLLHRLRPDPKKPAILRVGDRRVHFRWEKYRAVDWDTGEVLWPARHDLADLSGRQNLSPILFAREFQNDPVDDASSLFPTTLTQPVLDRGADFTFVPYYQKNGGEYTIAGMDVAASAEVGADYTVLWVAALSRWTGKGTILWGIREKGLGFKDQVGLLKMVCRNFDLDLGVIESNGFQKWLHAETQYLPETAGRLVPHRTGQEKADWDEGVPSVRLALENDLWTFPTGDETCRELGAFWQAEMHAFGWKDDKLQGVGEHDDTVMAWWFLDRARKLVEAWTLQAQHAEPDYVTGDDVGIERVRIGGDF